MPEMLEQLELAVRPFCEDQLAEWLDDFLESDGCRQDVVLCRASSKGGLVTTRTEMGETSGKEEWATCRGRYASKEMGEVCDEVGHGPTWDEALSGNRTREATMSAGTQNGSDKRARQRR